MEIYHHFNDAFNKDKGSSILSNFKFDFSSRLSYDNVIYILNQAMRNFMKNSIFIMENLISNQNINPINQIVFIISDGRFNKDVISL